jgi:peptidoglycan/LPS O-acetylase OafA/YrhL
MDTGMLRWLAARFELSRETSGANLRAMEGMRGFAVTLVFLTHFCSLALPWFADAPALAAFANGVHAIGNTGVDLFFVLSGYLIYKTLITREQPFAGFMARRIRRIYPAFLAVFALYCALSLVFPRENRIPAEAPLSYLAANLLLLPGIFPIQPLITVAWSLSYEMFFYLCMPLIITALRLRRWGGGQRIVFIALAAMAVAAWSTVSDNAYIRMNMFMAGMLVHEAIHGRRMRALPGRAAAGVLAAGLLGSLLPVDAHLKSVLLFASCFLTCMHCFLRPQGGLARAFSWTPLRWLGNMSYSYYLLHGLTLKALFMLLPPPAALAGHGAALFFLALPVFFVVTLFTSAGLFLLVERPLSLRVPAMTVGVIGREGQASGA